MEDTISQHVVEKFSGKDVTEDMMKAAAKLFSQHYGVWGTAQTFAKPGSRIRMNATHLRRQCMPGEPSDDTTYARILIDGQLAANVFACTWRPGREERTVCWVTQLVVKSDYRGQGLAKKLLSALRDDRYRCYGLMSSHAHACMAAVKAFGRNLGNESLDVIREHAPVFMAVSPVGYVRDAKPHGTLFDDATDGSISSADSNFPVDHAEPMAALELVKQRGISWPFGHLLEGHEYLVFIEPKNTRDDQ